MLTIDRLESSDELETAKIFDPYLCYVGMPLKGVFYPLGFPLELVTNSEKVLEAAEESWGEFSQQFEIAPIQLRIGVLEDGSIECPTGPVFRAHLNILVGIADVSNFCITDVVQGSSFAWLTAAATSHRNYLRYHYLEAVALAHIANRYSAPIHAACVELDGHGVLLCGESEAGKSSLSFACARAGWTYISDDASFLLNGRSDRRVVGNCHMVRLRPSARELFSEVEGKPLTPRVTGKPSIELRTATMPDIARAESSDVSSIVFLNRKDPDVQELVPFARESAQKFIDQRLFGLEELRKRQDASVARLLSAGIYELRYRDLEWAVDRLARLVRESR